MPSQADIVAEISRCRICAERFAATETAHQPRPVLVLSRTARVLIVGQAPGARVHASGVPFDDPSGDRLRGWMGIGRETFYDPAKLAIVPMGFCFPGYDAKGADLPPPKICAETWRTCVMASLPQIELTLVIGQYAQAWHLGKARGKSLTETVRHWRAFAAATPSQVPLPHPSWRNTAWLKKNPWFEEDVLPWLQGEVRRLCS
ncbi:MAG: uracil-DNA glycosylase family protein [Pseudomonadota bacterium]